MHACSIASLKAILGGEQLPESRVIAIGTVTQSRHAEATLSVEECLRTHRAAASLPLLNLHLGLGADCTLSVTREGSRYPSGVRILAFLEPAGSVWRADILGSGVVLLDGNDAYRFPDDESIEEVLARGPIATLAQIRERALVTDEPVLPDPGEPLWRPGEGETLRLNAFQDRAPGPHTSAQAAIAAALIAIGGGAGFALAAQARRGAPG